MKPAYSVTRSSTSEMACSRNAHSPISQKFRLWPPAGKLLLTFQSLAVSLCTTGFNIQKFYMALALR